MRKLSSLRGVKSGWVWLAVLAALLLPCFRSASASINASLTITGSEQSGDSGTITIAFDGFTESVAYSQYSSAASIASAFGGKFAKDYGAHVCTHAVGSTILFTLKGEATFGTLSVSDTGSSSSFQVNTAMWPTNLINPTVALVCDPFTVVSGSTTSCTASVAAAATGTVTFSLDGTTLSTVALSSGSATLSGLLASASAGPHLITAAYSGDGTYPAGSIDASVTVTSAPITVTATTVYSYCITGAFSSNCSSSPSGYAPNGNINGYTDQVNGTWSNLTYDSLNRLTGAAQAPVGGSNQYFCWTYDSFGNRTLQAVAPGAFASGTTTCAPGSGVTATTYTEGYDTANHLTSTPFSSPAYDAAGNITSDDTNQYLYDAEGRVCAVKGQPPISGEPNSLTGYIYDAEGNRVGKGNLSTFSCNMTSNGFTLTRSYVLDQEGHEVTEVGGDGQWVHTNVYAGGMLLATYDPSGAHFHVTDWLGSRRVQTDYLGRVEGSWQNLPFGEMVLGTPLGATSEHFTGKERDTESGNDYFGARYYASTMGRWMSPDWSAKAEPVPYAKLSNPQSLNLYGYMQNNPLGGVDADGHWPDWLKKAGSFAGSVGMGLAKFGANVLSFPGGDCSCQSRLAPPNAPSNGVEKATMITAAVVTAAAPVVDAAFGGSVTVTATTTPAAEVETQAATTTGYIGDNIVQGSGRVNGDLPGGQQAATDTFNQQTAGQNTQTLQNGHTVADDGTRLRVNSDGTARVDRPASVTGDQHETVHFNQPDKPQQP